MKALIDLSPDDREQLAETIALRLNPVMTVLGVLFFLVALGQVVARSEGVQLALVIVTWVLWTAFLVEFLVRLAVAPSIPGFLRRNWWQVLLLLLPFLSFVRLLRLARVGRAGRIVSRSIRVTRTARRSLGNRLLWLATVHVVLVLAGAEMAVEFAGYRSLTTALHDVAFSAVTGHPLGVRTAVAQVMEVFLGVYSVAVFASLAGAIGAFFLERTAEQAARPTPPGGPTSGHASA